jgi:hypothetical protein
MAGAVRFELTMPGSEPGALGLLATPQCKLIVSIIYGWGPRMPESKSGALPLGYTPT